MVTEKHNLGSRSHGSVMEEDAMRARIRALSRELKAGHEKTTSIKRAYGKSILRQRSTEKQCAKLRAEIESVSNQGGDCPSITARATSTASISCASSSLFGEDRETQIETLTDLVALLEAKIAVQNHARAQEALEFARQTMELENSEPLQTPIEVVQMERDALRRQLDAAMAAVAEKSGTPNAQEYAALHNDLENAQKVAELWRSRAVALEHSRGRAAEQTYGDANQTRLHEELLETKRTIGILLSERRLRESNNANSLPEASTGVSDIAHRSTRSKSAGRLCKNIPPLHRDLDLSRCRGIVNRHATYASAHNQNDTERQELFTADAARSDGLRDILSNF